MKTTPAAKTTETADQSEQGLLYRLVRELPLADVLRAIAAKEPTP